MLVRDQDHGDSDDVRALLSAAFSGYSHGQKLGRVASFRAAKAIAASLIAEDGGAIVGNVVFSPVQIGVHPEPVWYGLGPVAVHPARRRQGIGRALIEAGLDRLLSLGAGGCVVIGDTNYFRCFGFEHCERIRVEGASPEHCLTKWFDGPLPIGTVVRHP